MSIPSGISGIIEKASSLNSADQRFITGVTALALQPMFDLHNKKSDEDTRTIAACKSVAKGIACPLSGVTIRALFLKKAPKLCQKVESIFHPTNGLADEEISNLAKLFPKALKKTADGWHFEQDYMSKYENSVGNVLAVFVLLFTNFLFDAPVTKKLTNYFYKKVTGKDTTS